MAEIEKELKLWNTPSFKGVLIGFVVLIFCVSISTLRVQVLKEEQRRATNTVVELVEQNLEQTIQECYNMALSLALTVQADGTVRDFEEVAQKLIENNEYVDILELVPDGVIEYVYPLEGNESVLGYDIASDPKVNREVLKAAESRSMYFAGPIELRQGGKAVLGRLPIFIKDELWGFSAVIISLDNLVESSGMNALAEHQYYFQLSKVNPNTFEEEFFLPINKEIELENVEQVEFPEGDWKLYATYVGKDQAFNSLIILLVLSIICSILIGYLAIESFKKPFQLRRLVNEKSRLLMESTAQHKRNSEILTSVLESPREMVIFSVDSEYNYLAFNSVHKQLAKYLWGVDIQVGMNMLENVTDEDMKAKLKSDFDRALNGEYFDYSSQFDLEEGVSHFWDNRFSPIYSQEGEVVGITAYVTNVTKRKLAETEIVAEKQLSDTVIESLPGIFYLYNQEGEFYRWNSNFEKVTEYSSEDMKKAHPLNFFREEDHQLLTEKIQNVFVAGEDSVEALFKTKSGDLIPYYFTGAAIDYKGEKCLLGVGLDLSAKTQAENELKRVLKELQTHLDNSPLGVVEYDSDLNIIGWTKRCEEIFGWTADEILGTSAYDLIYEADLDKTKEVGNNLQSGEVEGNTSYNRNYTKSGDLIDCLWYNSVIKDDDGNVITVMSLVEDVTERRKNELAIVNSERKLANLISNLPGFVYRCRNDEGWTMTYLSDACKEILGYASEEIVGSKDIAYADIILPEDRERVWKTVQEAVKEGKRFELRYRIKTKTGEIRWMLEKGMAVKGGNGTEKLEGFVQDVTQQVETQTALENNAKEKATLLSEIHHRVKNNLAIVSGLLQLQSREVEDEELKLPFEQSINRVISIAMVHELMYKSPDLSSVNINEYLDLLIPAIASTMQDYNKDVTFDIHIEEFNMNINQAIPLGLLLNELFTNSFKYAFVGRKEGKISVTLTHDEEAVKIVYEDDGVGFPEDTDFNIPTNLGLNLIHSQIMQLEASYKVDTNNRFRLEFTFNSMSDTEVSAFS